MLNFRYADINDLDFLVELRIRDLRLFSNQEILPQTINKIRDLQNRYYQWYLFYIIRI